MPVAGEVVGGDGVERQVEHHAALLARAAQGLGHLLERGLAGGLGGDAGDGGRRRREAGGGMFRARNIRAFRGEIGGEAFRQGGEAAAGHQAVSFSRAAVAAASSSRRQEARSRRLKPA